MEMRSKGKWEKKKQLSTLMLLKLKLNLKIMQNIKISN